MKVVHINTNAKQGGAAIAARRHCLAMKAAGIESKMLVYRGGEDDITTCYPYKRNSLFQRIKDSITFRFSRFLVKYSMWNLETRDLDITPAKEIREADLIYIHWVAGYLGTKGVQKILEMGKPVVWYMHDMNPITGGCHYSFACNEYRKDCSHCKELIHLKSLAKRQLKNHRIWNAYPNLIGAAPSQWLTECIRKSSVFRDHSVFCVPNVIDTNIFKPLDKKHIREKFHLPMEKKLIMFASMGAHSRYKGSQYLVQVVNTVAENQENEFIVAGSVNLELFSPRARTRIHPLGTIHDERQMAEIYNAADVYLITSMAENFPNVIIEAMACGVPAVGFSTGGIKDQIHHKENGWIAEPKDVEGLIQGLHWVLNDADIDVLGYNARQYVVENCSYQNVLKVHADILQMIK